VLLIYRLFKIFTTIGRLLLSYFMDKNLNFFDVKGDGKMIFKIKNYKKYK
jgi:hypothetical protein